jgi:hypothetical protein
MDKLFFIMFIFLIATGSIICIFFPKQYLLYRNKEINKKNAKLLFFRGIFLLFLLMFFIFMFSSTR